MATILPAPRLQGAAFAATASPAVVQNRARQDVFFREKHKTSQPVDNKGTSTVKDSVNLSAEYESHRSATESTNVTASNNDHREPIRQRSADASHDGEALVPLDCEGLATAGFASADHEEVENDEDWLLDSDDELSCALNAAPTDDHTSLPVSMEHRDWQRVHARFHDQGYKEGITAGKLSTLQSGFDIGFGGAGGGAQLGRRVGRLRGEVGSMLGILAVRAGVGSDSGKMTRQRGTSGSRPSRTNPSDDCGSVGVSDVAKRLAALYGELEALDVESVAEPDWEAIEHAKSHEIEGEEDSIPPTLEAGLSELAVRQQMNVQREARMANFESSVAELRSEVMHITSQAKP